MPRRVLDLLSSWGNSLGHGQAKQIWKQVPLCVMWGLWRERNAWHFEDVEMSVLELCRNVLNALFIWVLAHHSPSRIMFAEF
jgi:Na+/H+ antiporter NhaC